MHKEKLTVDNIKQDLCTQAKECYKELVGMIIAFIIVLLLVLICSNSLITLKAIVLWLLCCCGAVALLFVIVNQIKTTITLRKNLKNNIVVIDKLIYTETKLKRHGRITVTYYYLHFSQYGKFQIPDENYKWSSCFSMSDKGVYNYSSNGDEFYLVLSKPHIGKILYVYNTKMFEME